MNGSNDKLAQIDTKLEQIYHAYQNKGKKLDISQSSQSASLINSSKTIKTKESKVSLKHPQSKYQY